MIPRRLLEWLAKPLQKQEIAQYVKLPSLFVVEDLEVANELRHKVDPREYLIVHDPSLINHPDASYPSHPRIAGKRREGILVRGKNLSHNMAGLYLRQHSSSQSPEAALRSLEESVMETSAKTQQNMQSLESAARSLLTEHGDNEGNVGYDQAQLMALIHDITVAQFEYPEHFIREAVQNADGAWQNKLENRIDVFIDRKNRTIRVADKGRGMDKPVVENAFFNLYASLNEALSYAAGKFGIGAVSFFGLKHDHVRIDTKQEEGDAISVLVDGQLQREYVPSTQHERGTTVEIKLAGDSPIDFDKIVEILREDCCYIETPTYLHDNGTTEFINKELTPEGVQNTVGFSEKNVQGYVRLGSGELKLLSHRIRLRSIPTVGYSGVVNCAGLDTTFSRDTVLDDPVLRDVLRYVNIKQADLRRKALDNNKLSLEARLNDYQEFLHSRFFDGNGVNAQFLRAHAQSILYGSRFQEYTWEKMSEQSTSVQSGFGLRPAGYLFGYAHAIGSTMLQWARKKLGIKQYALVCHTGDMSWTKREVIDARSFHDRLPSTTSDVGEAGFAGLFLSTVTTLLGGAAAYGLTKDGRCFAPLGVMVAYDVVCAAESAARIGYHMGKELVKKAFVHHANHTLYGSYIPGAEADTKTAKSIAGVALGLAGIGGLLWGVPYVISHLSTPDTPSVSQPKNIEERAEEPKEHSRQAPQPTPQHGEQDSDIPYELPLGIAFGTGLAMTGFLHHRNKRRMLQPYTDSLTADEQKLLDGVQESLGALPTHVPVYYGSNLGRDHPAFLVTRRGIILNRTRKEGIEPAMPALAYASTILKDASLSDRIAEKLS
ncbi:hypothetical protein HYS47_03195 [Candidatus Woesearchaeota archaeon]|nr:hypothetical protein [Candidatus Woesearchaeota archaeon]